ncbi:Gfo/Idh/MocA family oxidoreductase [Kineococcus sp. TBRC 1896]|uniref:Gfo/Idh/MocA family oxidoreductase n=1 Tax=Kineococcus mangrovi TaxID=1660183 RepID=A0ABV4I6F5_9ACTN
MDAEPRREPLRLGVVGTGYRAGLFLDLVARVPHLLQVTGVLGRSRASAEAVVAGRGLRVADDPAGLLATSPELVLVVVPAAQAAATVTDLVGRGAHVLTETPPAPDLDGLRALWDVVGASGRVQVAEQYLLFPHNAARLRVVRDGAVGGPTSVQVSSTQTYHATSMIRGFLGLGAEPVRVVASATTAPLADPIARPGWTGDAQPHPLTTTVATFDVGDGRSALYDFTQTQTRNPLRARRLVVRGSLGELVDDRVVRLADATTVLTSSLERRQTGHRQDVQGLDLDQIAFEGRVVFRNPFTGSRLSDEEIALTLLLQRAGAWARGEGPGPYPLAEAAQDHLLGLAVDEAVRTGRPVTTTSEAWAGGLGG